MAKSMTTIQDRIIKDFRKKVNELRGLLPRTDEDSEVVNFGYKTSRGNELFTVVDWGNIEQFLIKSIKEVEEETRKEVVEECKQKMAQSNEWWNKKLLSITNKEK